MGKGRAPCCAKVGLNKGSWTPEEDMRLIAYIHKYGHANWRALPKQAGLLRCGKSCRLRWINYLRPDLKRGNFTAEEEEAIIRLHAALGNKWSKIAACLPGRTDNEIKNVWNTHLKKRVVPPGWEERTKKKKNKDAGEEVPPVPSLSQSPSSSTTTTNCSSGGGGDSGVEQQSSAGADRELDLDTIEIPMLDLGFDFDDMLVDPVPPPPPEMTHSCPAVSASVSPASPCASSTSPPPPCARGVGGFVLDLPELDIDQELWSIIDGDGGGCVTEAPPPCQQGNATEAGAATTTTSPQEWWLESLEQELGLWGPVEEYHYLMDPQGQVGLADPLPAMVDDPVSCYFQAGPAALEGPECSAVLTNQMDL